MMPQLLACLLWMILGFEKPQVPTFRGSAVAGLNKYNLYILIYFMACIFYESEFVQLILSLPARVFA